MSQSIDSYFEELESAAEKTTRIFLDMVRANAEPSRITPEMSSLKIRQRFRDTLGRQGNGLMATLEAFEQQVLPHSLRISNPMYMGLVNSSPLPGAALMDCLVSALDNNTGASHHGPSADACEREVIRSLSELLGLDVNSTGQFVPGGSYANLHGLLLARTHCAQRTQAGYDQMTLYSSEACHFSIARAANVIGLASKNLKVVPTQGRGTMDTEALAAMIAEDKSAGLAPCAVVSNLGSTGTGALDPLDEIVAICERQGVWNHVDACVGGPLLLMDEFAKYRDAVAHADSFSVDLHKWFYLPLTASLIMTRHSRLEADCFEVDPSYIPQGDLEPYQRGMATSRRATGLTAWLTIRAYGWDAIENAARANIRLTRLLENKLLEAGLKVLPGGELSGCGARLDDEGWPPDFHEQVANNIRQQGVAWFATVQHDGQIWWRFNILNLYADESHVALVTKLLIEEIGRVAEAQAPQARYIAAASTRLLDSKTTPRSAEP